MRRVNFRVYGSKFLGATLFLAAASGWHAPEASAQTPVGNNFPDATAPYRLYLNSPDSDKTVPGRINSLGQPVPG